MIVKTSEIRRSKGLTQKEAAQYLGMSFRTYQNYESGRSNDESFVGRSIKEKLSNYEPYSETKGILPLVLLKETTAEVLKETKIEYAYLFGSYAKGKPNEKSDVDILISGEIDGLAYFSLAETLRGKLHKKVDLLRFADLKNNQELLNEILATGFRIYSKNI
jgi:predicted nucleotidyltransferase